MSFNAEQNELKMNWFSSIRLRTKDGAPKGRAQRIAV